MAQEKECHFGSTSNQQIRYFFSVLLEAEGFGRCNVVESVRSTRDSAWLVRHQCHFSIKRDTFANHLPFCLVHSSKCLRFTVSLLPRGLCQAGCKDRACQKCPVGYPAPRFWRLGVTRHSWKCFER
jgi:hypothetical protein